MWWFISAFILKSLDIITTAIAISIRGIGVEANPIMRYGMESWLGVGGTLGVSFVFTLLVTIYCFSRFPPAKKWIPGIVVNVMLLPVVINNTIQLAMM